MQRREWFGGSDQNEGRLGPPLHSEQRSEVGIVRDDHAVIIECVFEDLLVARVLQADVSNGHSVVAGLAQQNGNARREVGINEKSHADRVNGSSRS